MTVPAIQTAWGEPGPLILISSEERDSGIADGEARSISQICELLLSEGVQTYKKDGPKFLQRLVAK
jgi:hypothetical protein